MLILEHFSTVFKLLDKTLEIWWLLPSLIKINKKLVADFVKSLCFFVPPSFGLKPHKISPAPAPEMCILPFEKQTHGQNTVSEESF